MSVSLCLMVRNEEEKLAVCLQSATDLVDEIIVVDTGSTDGTLELAVKFGARVFEFPWVDDFAAGRNECIRHATGDFIFWMDADERVDPLNRDKLKALFDNLLRSGDTETGRHGDTETTHHSLNDHSPNDHSPLTNVAYVMNCWSVGKDAPNTGTVVQHVRLFPNRPDVRWKYRVHEQILPALRATGAEVIFTDIVIQHTGYVDPAFTRQKLERNLRLLHLDHVDHPNDPYILFHLGWGHLELNQVPEAIAFLRASLDGSQPGDSIVKKLFALLAQAHHRLGQRNEALAACRSGRARYPEDQELLYLEGIFHRERREWGQAIGCLQKLVGRKEENNRRERGELGEGAEKTIQKGQHSAEPSTLPSASSAFSAVKNSSFGSADVGLNGYLARHQLALVYYQQGRWEEAEAEWKLALADRPGYMDAVKGLGEMYLKQARWPELDEVIERLRGGKKARNHEIHESHEKEEKTENHGFHGEHGYEGEILQARGMLARKEFTRARGVLEPMVGEQPAALYPRVILSHVYLQEGHDLQAAEGVLREIVQLDPSQAESWRNLAVLLREQGRLEEAVEVCRNGWRHCLDYPTLPLLLGITLADQGNFAGAEMSFLRLLELPYEGPMPDEHVEARHQLALVYQKTGHAAEAEAQWRTILADRPDYQSVVRRQWSVVSSKKQISSQDCQQLVVSDPKADGDELRTTDYGQQSVVSRQSSVVSSKKQISSQDCQQSVVSGQKADGDGPRTTDNGQRTNVASIIILCCNQLEYTRQCLESVLSCTRYPYELILVDNGSTDGTREYLEEIRSRVLRVPLTTNNSPLTLCHIEIMRNESNLGYPAGCNQALARSSGRYLVFLNNDTIVTEGWLDGLIAFVTHDWPQTGLVGPVTNAATEPQQISVDYADLAGLPAFAARRRQENAGRALRVDRLTGFCLLVRREVFKQVGGFDEQFGLGFFDDDDLCVRAREAGFQLLLAEDVFVHHFGNRTFRGLGIDCTKQIVSNFERFKNKWGSERAAGYRLVGAEDN